MLDEVSLREFYEFVYPVDLITTWLAYDLQHVGAVTVDGFSTKDELKSEAAVAKSEESRVGGAAGIAAAEGYLARREFCFTLLGDIFTRFRSYRNATELRTELVRSFPEKIDVGAVYSIRPNQKQGVGTIQAMERELVFDIDMSDYDNVRSCCSGKCICRYCWAWMACAAQVLRTVLEDDFGFKYILPVFSGRRGIHLWVCDKRARRMHDDERAALVGYLTVVMPKTLRSTVTADLANHRPIHPTIRHVLNTCINPSFTELFVLSEEANPNNVQTSPKAARIVYDAIVAILKLGRRDALGRFLQNCSLSDGNVLNWATVRRALGNEHEAQDLLHGAQLLLMYPRLDEHVSTRRDHLLKLPFCVHPGTASLCCPLEWDGIAAFDPVVDSPKLSHILLERHIDQQWITPLERMLERMRKDPEEQ